MNMSLAGQVVRECLLALLLMLLFASPLAWADVSGDAQRRAFARTDAGNGAAYSMSPQESRHGEQ